MRRLDRLGGPLLPQFWISYPDGRTVEEQGSVNHLLPLLTPLLEERHAAKEQHPAHGLYGTQSPTTMRTSTRTRTLTARYPSRPNGRAALCGAWPWQRPRQRQWQRYCPVCMCTSRTESSWTRPLCLHRHRCGARGDWEQAGQEKGVSVAPRRADRFGWG